MNSNSRQLQYEVFAATKKFRRYYNQALHKRDVSDRERTLCRLIKLGGSFNLAT